MDATHVASEPTDRRSPTDGGFTLTEVLIAIVLSAVLVLTVVGAVWTLVRASGLSDEQARVEAVLGAAADRLVTDDWEACPEETGAYLARVEAAAVNVGWQPHTVAIERYEYWDISAGDWTTVNPYGVGVGVCHVIPTTAASSRMQRITIRASSPGHTHSRTLQVVVGDIKFLDEQED